MTRVTAYAFTFKGLDGGRDPACPRMRAIPCWWSTPRRFAATPRNMPACRRFGRATATAALSSWGYHPMISAVRSPAGASDIHSTAQGQYHVTFPMAEKVSVKGKDAHPFYKWAVAERPLEAPRWNFHKYLIGRDGYLKAAFSSAVEPTDPIIVAAIEKELTAA